MCYSDIFVRPAHGCDHWSLTAFKFSLIKVSLSFHHNQLWGLDKLCIAGPFSIICQKKEEEKSAEVSYFRMMLMMMCIFMCDRYIIYGCIHLEPSPASHHEQDTKQGFSLYVAANPSTSDSAFYVFSFLLYILLAWTSLLFIAGINKLQLYYHYTLWLRA